MTDPTTYERVQSKLTSVFQRLNQRGINPGGRLAVNLELWAPAASANKLKAAPLARVPDSDIPVVVIDLKRGVVKRWDESVGLSVPVGDARLEIARNQPDDTPLTLELLAGEGLTAGQERRVRMGDELYTVIRGGVEDPTDSYTWFLTLKRLEA